MEEILIALFTSEPKMILFDYNDTRAIINEKIKYIPMEIIPSIIDVVKDLSVDPIVEKFFD